MEESQPQRAALEARLEALRAERSLERLDASSAVLDYEIGALLEHGLAQPAEALQHYLLAQQESPAFRPAFDAVTRILEERRAFDRLARLHAEEVSAAMSRGGRASARLALGSVEAARGAWDRATEAFRAALDEDPSSQAAAAFLELAARRTGDERSLLVALDRAISTSKAPALASILQVDRAERSDLSLLERTRRLASVDDGEGLASRALADAHLELGDHAARARALADAAQKLAEGGFAAEAAALFAEAAAVELEVLFAPRSAFAHARKAAEIADADSLWLLAWEAARRGGDREAQAEIEAAIFAREARGVRAEVLVESALASVDAGDLAEASRLADAAFEASPSAPLLLLCDLLSAKRGAHRERIERLRAFAQRGAEDAAWALVLASDVAEQQLGDVELAASLAREARASEARSAEASARAFDLAKRSGDLAALDVAAANLARATASTDVRRVALFERTSARLRAGSAALDASLLEDLLSMGEPWAAELVRVHGIAARNPLWAARAHETLARLENDAPARAAHLATAARLRIFEGDVDGAAARVDEALEARPHHPYALALAAEIARLRGDEAAAERFRVRRAQGRFAHGDAEPLAEALDAEARGDLERAAALYAARADDPLALDGLRRLAPLVSPALASKCYAILDAEGAPGAKTAALELSLRGHGERRPGLDPQDLEMAWDVMLSERTASARVEASEALGGGDPKVVPLMKVARHIDGLAGDRRFEPRDEGLLARYVEARYAPPAARAAALGSLMAPGDEGHRELGALSAALLAQMGEDALADAFIAAQALLDEARDVHAALAIEETVSVADEPGQLGWAMAERIAHSPELRGHLQAAAARAFVLAGLGQDALDAARRAVTEDPEDLASWDALRVAAHLAGDAKRHTRACEVLADAAPPRWSSALLEEAGVSYADLLGDFGAAEATFLRALRTDGRSPVALQRLLALYRSEGRDDARIELLADWVSRARDDDPELPHALYELAGLLRVADRLEEASVHVERLTSIASEDPAALALGAEIHVARGRWEDAVRFMRRLAVAKVPASQQRIARLAAADFLEKKLDRPEAALAELEELLAAGLADAKTIERMAKIDLRLGRVEDAARAYEHAGRRLTGPEAARLLVLAGRLRAKELRQPAEAEALYRRALQLHPLALDAVVGSMELTADFAETKRLTDRANEIIRASLPLTRCDVSLLRAVHALATLRGDHERASAMLEALVALGNASQEELTRVTEVTTIVKPRGYSVEALVDCIGELATDHPLIGIGAQYMPKLLEAIGVGLEPLGFSKSDKLTATSRSPVRDELNEIAARFGLGPFDLYRGGNAERGIHLVPTKKGAAWLVGEGVSAPLSPASRFSAAAQAFGLFRGTLPFVLLDQAGSEALVARLAHVDGRALPGLGPDPALLAAFASLDASIGFFERRALRETISALGSGSDVSRAITGARREAQRAALSVVVELHEALRAIVGGEVNPASVEASPDALALLSFWIRPEATRLRALVGAHA